MYSGSYGMLASQYLTFTTLELIKVIGLFGLALLYVEVSL
jgi:hypothetical protein